MHPHYIKCQRSNDVNNCGLTFILRKGNFTSTKNEDLKQHVLGILGHSEKEL